MSNPVVAPFRAAWTPAGFPGASGCAETAGASAKLAATMAMQKDRMVFPCYSVRFVAADYRMAGERPSSMALRRAEFWEG